jgi:hypothetical protein
MIGAQESDGCGRGVGILGCGPSVDRLMFKNLRVKSLIKHHLNINLLSTRLLLL